ncbi:MAG: hypothetical protein K2X99_08110 [Gemmatimonadaceae bacterium]|nr:hypothetical protein [Gemmatimonadaceae bacterium]
MTDRFEAMVARARAPQRFSAGFDDRVMLRWRAAQQRPAFERVFVRAAPLLAAAALLLMAANYRLSAAGDPLAARMLGVPTVTLDAVWSDAYQLPVAGEGR